MIKNKKVRNATPVTLDGINFRSKLERYCYEQLKLYNIECEYEKYSYTLLPAFKYNDENVRAITYKPDFVGLGWVIECKGFMNETYPIRAKLFKWYLHSNDIQVKFLVVHNHKEVDNAIKIIKDEELLSSISCK